MTLEVAGAHRIGVRVLATPEPASLARIADLVALYELAPLRISASVGEPGLRVVLILQGPAPDCERFLARLARMVCVRSWSTDAGRAARRLGLGGGFRT